jgi:hypothetical protein
MKAIHFLLLLLLAGCNLPATQPANTQVPATQPRSTTVIPLPTQPAPSTATQPVASQPAPTQAAPTQAGQAVPEAIAILEPGSGSRVISPLRVSGVADPTFEQSLVVTIVLADGTPLVTSSAQIGADVGQRGPYALDVPFSVNQEQPGFIQVYAVSARDGGITHLSSVGVTLAPGGAADLRAAAEGPEQIELRQPANGATVSGGVLHVEGFGLATFEQTLLVELLDEAGQPLASTPVIVAAPDLGQPGAFSADLPYTLATASIHARLQVRDISPAHSGNTHLTSVEITLLP